MHNIGLEMSRVVHYAVLDRAMLSILEKEMEFKIIDIEHRCKKCGKPTISIILSKKKVKILEKLTGTEFNELRFISSQYVKQNFSEKVFNVGDFGLYARCGGSLVKVKHI